MPFILNSEFKFYIGSRFDSWKMRFELIRASQLKRYNWLYYMGMTFISKFYFSHHINFNTGLLHRTWYILKWELVLFDNRMTEAQKGDSASDEVDNKTLYTSNVNKAAAHLSSSLLFFCEHSLKHIH